MTGLAIIATGLMAGYGFWRGKQVESRNNIVDEFSQSYNYNNQTMGFDSPIPALFNYESLHTNNCTTFTPNW